MNYEYYPYDHQVCPMYIESCKCLKQICKTLNTCEWLNLFNHIMCWPFFGSFLWWNPSKIFVGPRRQPFLNKSKLTFATVSSDKTPSLSWSIRYQISWVYYMHICKLNLHHIPQIFLQIRMHLILFKQRKTFLNWLPAFDLIVYWEIILSRHLPPAL